MYEDRFKVDPKFLYQIVDVAGQSKIVQKKKKKRKKERLLYLDPLGL